MANDSTEYFGLVLKHQTTENFRYLDEKFNESPIENWTPLEVDIITKGGNKKVSDAPCFWDNFGYPVLSSKALKWVEDLLSEKVEILPLIHEKYDFYALNVMNIINCLDLEKCIVERFPSSGRIMRIEKYVFYPDHLENQHLFKMAEAIKTHVCVSDEFRNRVLDSKLKGFVFKELWDSEE